MSTDPAARLHAAGFGLREGLVELRRSTAADVAAGGELRNVVAATVGDRAIDVIQVGSMSVVGLLAKPLVDLAVGVSSDRDVDELRACLLAAGWTYRGDAGDEGGHIFMLDAAERVRVAHAHVVEHDGRQWRAYVALRDLIRADPVARDRYEAEKRRLAGAHSDDRLAYTNGKSDVIAELLAVAADRASAPPPPG